MNPAQLIQSYFDDAALARLGQATGLNAAQARSILQVGVPQQLKALAEHGATPEGEAQIREAIDNLPAFGSVQDALDELNGAAHLQEAGQLLAPVLLGAEARNLPAQVAAQVGATSGVAQLLHMALPLLLSFLGRQSGGAAGIGSLLSGLRGGLEQLWPAGAGAAATGAIAAGAAVLGGLQGGVQGGAAGEGEAPASAGTPETSVEPLKVEPTQVESIQGEPTQGDGAAAASGMGARLGTTAAPVAVGAALGGAALAGPPTSESLLEWLRSQFAGPVAEQVGKAAGFSGATAGRATLAALPLVLNALVNKGQTETGAAELLKMAQPLGALTTADGGLNTSVLGDPAETARVEGQGRGLLGGLFGNLEALTGRLGSAIGGSGANAGRLLALLTPLVLALLGRNAQHNGLGAGALAGLLGGMGGGLAGLLPAGLSSLGALLGAGALTGAAAAAPATGMASTVVASAAPSTPMVSKPSVTPPPVAVPSPSVAPTPERKRGGFPWWLIPLLLLLLLGGCWLVNRNTTGMTTGGTAASGAATGTAGAAAGALAVNTPAEGTDLPAAAFTMSGTGTAGEALSITNQGAEVGTATVGADGTWSADLPAPTAGEQTYTVSAGGGNTQAEVRVNVTDQAAGDASGAAGADGTGSGTEGSAGTDSADTGAAGTDTAGAAAGAFRITEPSARAELPAGGFTLSGTGTAGQQIEVFEDGVSLGTVTVGADGRWTQQVPSPTAGAHTYSIQGEGGSELASVATTVAAAAATGAACTQEYTLSIQDGQTVNEPFRFGGVGGGEGYSVTVKRGERLIGTKDIKLDATCGWAYQSRPGAGTITYEVRPLGDASAAPLSTVRLTVAQ